MSTPVALRLGNLLQVHGTLHSCFVHKRKHKLLKRFANQLSDTFKDFDTSLLLEDAWAQSACTLVQPRPAVEGQGQCADPAWVPRALGHISSAYAPGWAADFCAVVVVQP